MVVCSNACLVGVAFGDRNISCGRWGWFHESLKNMIAEFWKNALASLITIIPPYITTLLLPNAFITVLGFAGMILVVIAVLLPAYLCFKQKDEGIL